MCFLREATIWVKIVRMRCSIIFDILRCGAVLEGSNQTCIYILILNNIYFSVSYNFR